MNENTALFKRGAILLRMNRTREAIKSYKKILSKDPKNSNAHMMLSLCLTNEGQHEQAWREAGLAVTFDPENSGGFYARAIAQSNNDFEDEALESVEYAISLEPETARFHVFRAKILLGMQRIEDARDACKTALSIDSQNTDALTTLTELEIQLGNYKTANQIAIDAVYTDPIASKAHVALGRSLIHANYVDDAFESFNQALRLDPQDSQAHSGLVSTLKMQNPLSYALRIYCRWMFRFGFMTQLILLVLATVLLAASGIIPCLFSKSMSGLLKPVFFTASISLMVFCGITWVLFWLSSPISYAMLLLSPQKWQVLKRSEKVNTILFLVLLVSGISFVLLANFGTMPRCFLLGAGLLMLMQPSFLAIKNWNKPLLNLCLLMILSIFVSVIAGDPRPLSLSILVWGVFNAVLFLCLIKNEISHEIIE